MKDLLLENNDLGIENGDLVIDESDEQNVVLLLRLSKGNIKQYPLVGFGEERLLGGVVDAKMRRAIQMAVGEDGYQVAGFSQDANGYLNVEI